MTWNVLESSFETGSAKWEGSFSRQPEAMNDKKEEIVKASIRTLATLVPGAGVFVQAWSEYDSFKSKERIEKLLRDFTENICDRMAHVVEERVKSDFPTLLEKIVEKVRSEPSESKRTDYAKLLANSFMANKAVSLDEKLNAIDSLDVLTEADLQVLRHFSAGHKIRVDHFVPTSQFYQFPPELEENVGRLVVSLQKLESRGLIAPTTPINEGFDWEGEKTDWVNVWREKTYVLLPFGRKFCSLIWD
jgi:hypothetical protein